MNSFLEQEGLSGAVHSETLNNLFIMSIVRKSAQTLTAHILILAQGILLTPIVIKISGAEVYGGFILTVSYLGILFGISSLGVGISAKRWLPSHDDARDRSALFFPQFSFQLATTLILSLLSMLAYAWASSTGKLHLPGFSMYLIPGYLLTYVLLSQTTDYFRYTHRVGVFNVATVAQSYLFISLSLLGYFFAGILNTGSLIFMHMTASLLVSAPLLYRLHAEIGFHYGLPDKTALRNEIRVGLPLLLSSLVDLILDSGDRYIIAVILSVRDVGIYAPAYTLGSLVIALPRVFGVVLPPLLSQHVDAGDSAGARQIMSGAIRAFLLVSVPFVVGALVLGEPVLRLFANEEVSNAAWMVTPLVALGSLFYGLMLISSNLLFVRLKTGALFRINAAAAVLNVGLNIILLHLFKNVIVAAIATLLSYFVSYLWLRRTMLGDEVFARISFGWLLRLMAAAGIMGGMILLVIGFIPLKQGPIQISAGLLVGLSTYTIILLTWKGIAGEEIALLRSSLARA